MTSRRELSLEEIAYMGKNIETGPKPGDLLMVAEESILTNQFEAIITNPMELPGQAKGMFLLLTFKGIVNNDGRLKAVTVIAVPELAINLTKKLRRLYTEIPVEYR